MINVDALEAKASEGLTPDEPTPDYVITEVWGIVGERYDTPKPPDLPGNWYLVSHSAVGPFSHFSHDNDDILITCMWKKMQEKKRR